MKTGMLKRVPVFFGTIFVSPLQNLNPCYESL